MEFWEILVPTQFNDGTPIRLRYHRVWDERVRTLTGGLTVLSPARGTWMSPCGRLFRERMIPVRVIATREQMDSIAAMTMDYYRQEAVLFYRVSDHVVMCHRSGQDGATILEKL
jgi:hypothetical protein